MMRVAYNLRPLWQASLLVLAVQTTTAVPTQAGRYEPTWESLDSRPLPAWYDEAKFGIFIHWGVFSVPSFGTEWFWERWQTGSPAFVEFMKKNYPPGWTYADFAPHFTAEFYDAYQWADILKSSGAKYVVLTSKHHEGFCNWHTNVSFNWNSVAVGPRRDLVGELMTAIVNSTDMHFGLYHSLFEWFNPLFLSDKANNFKTRKFVESKTMPELYELVKTYKPEVVWSDGDAADPDYWGSREFLAWLYNDSPVKETVVTNDRWGSGCTCKHGGYYTCHDRYNPGKLQGHKWENCMTIDKSSWGFRREARLQDFLTMDDLTKVLAETISCGGNLLMNIGPTHDGRIVPIFEERLRDMGAWLKVNGDAIYASVPWTHQNDTVTPGVWYTSEKSASGSVFAIFLDWPADNRLSLGAVASPAAVSLLGGAGGLKWAARAGGGVTVDLPHGQRPCDWAWVLRLDGLKARPWVGFV